MLGCTPFFLTGCRSTYHHVGRCEVEEVPIEVPCKSEMEELEVVPILLGGKGILMLNIRTQHITFSEAIYFDDWYVTFIMF